MKKIKILSYLFILTLLTTSFAFSQTDESTNAETLSIEIISSDTASINLRFDNINPLFESTTINNQEYTQINLEDEGFNTIAGHAKLPKIRRMIEIPQEAIVTLEVKNVEWDEYQLEQQNLPETIIPVSVQTTKNSLRSEKITETDHRYYSTNQYFPNEIAKINTIGEIRGHRYALIEISPVFYNPVEGFVKTLQSCELTIQLSGSDIELTKEKINRYTTDSHQQLINSLLLNSDHPLFNPENTNRNNGEGYLFIVYDDFEDELQNLVSVKDSQGFVTTVTKTSDIPGGATADNIKAYIEDAYNNWNPPPSYVLLVGDVAQVPTFTGSSSSTDTDTYYGTMDSDDFSDIYIGRFPADTGGQVTAMVDKTVDYIQGDFPSNDFIKKAVYMAGDDNYQVSEGTHNYVITNYMDPNNYVSDKVYEVTYGATSDDTRDSLNDGRSLAVFSGHGATTYWADGPEFHQSDVNGLTNQGLYPFACSHACVTGKFSVSECFAETWLRAPDKASIAFWSSSANTLWDEDDILEKEMFSAWWDDDLELIGEMTDKALYELYQYYGGGGYSNYYLECYNVMGDPSIKVWRNDPLTADFTHSPEYPNPGDTIYFTDQSIGAESWQWHFGDDSSSNLQNPTHVYSSEGVYDVSLTIYGQGKTDSTVKQVEVYNNWPPVSIPNPDFYAGNNPEVCFNGADSWDPDGSIASYHWDFDDGSTSDQMSICHTYQQDGIYDVTLTVTDDQGKQAVAHAEIRIDAYTPPETDVTFSGAPGNNGWYRSIVSITFGAYDWSGVETTYYSLDGGSWQVYDDPAKVYSDGVHTVSFYSVDIWGNEETVKNETFKLDNSNPELTVELNGQQQNDWFISPVEVICEATDEGSGIDAIYYLIEEINRDEWSVYNGSFMMDEDGCYVLRVYAEDVAGNTIGRSKPYSICIDTATPETSCILNGDGSDGVYYKQVTIDLSAVDDGSGVNYTMYRLDGGNWQMYDAPFVVDSSGDHTLEFYSADMIGQIEETQAIDFTINNINFDLSFGHPADGGLYVFGNRLLFLNSVYIIGTIDFEAELTPFNDDTDFIVDTVEFIVDGEVMESMSSAPFVWTWSNRGFGSHEVMIRAVNEGDSVEVSMEAFVIF